MSSTTATQTPAAQSAAAPAHDAHGSHGSTITPLQAGVDAIQMLMGIVAFISVYRMISPVEINYAPALVAFSMVLSVLETDNKKMLLSEMLVGAGFIASWNINGGHSDLGLALLGLMIILNGAQILILPGLTWLTTSGHDHGGHDHHP